MTMCGISYSTRSLLASSALIALGLVAQPASAAFIVYTNDSVISASSSITAYLNDLSPSVTDSHSASQTFPSATSIPVSTSGAVTANSSVGGKIIYAWADISSSITNNAGVVSVFSLSEGSVQGPNGGAAQAFQYSSSSVFDVTFELTSGFQYLLDFDVNGFGGTGGTLELTNVATATQVDYLSLNQNNFGGIRGLLDPGLYRLRVNSAKSGGGTINYVDAVFSNAVSGTFTPTGPEVVPIPPAVWLFGSALGLMGVVRRRITN